MNGYGVAALNKSGTSTDYATAIGVIASSEFSGAPAVIAAASIQSIGASDEAALRWLLGVTNAGTWAFIKQGRAASLVPEIAMPAERIFLERLNADPAVSASHRHYRLWLDRENAKNEEWVTAGSLERSEGWKRIKGWSPFPSANSATFADREYGYFDGQWKLSATEPIYRLESLQGVEETSVFGSVGLGKLWSGGSTYGKPVMEVLDAIKNSRDGSSVFRAYLFCSLVQFMEFQPDAWGLSFCPSAHIHAAQILTIADGQIASGDWFVPSKAKDWSEKLDRFFAAQTSLSYARQAAGNLTLAELVTRDGLRFVGFVGMDGKAVLTQNAQSAETWAYDATSKQPVLASKSAMPLSPLFALPASRAEYLARAKVSAEAPSFANALPPLFLAPRQ